MIALPRAIRPLVVAVGYLFAAWLRTLRVRIHLPEGDVLRLRDYRFGAEIYALSERDLLALAATAACGRFHLLVADGHDGDWAAALATPLRCRITRGSSLRNGLAAMRALIRDLEASPAPAAIVADGPVGPAGVAKAGVVALSAWTGRPIISARARASSKITFRASWAGHYLPLPFARVDIHIAPPVLVRSGTTRSEMQDIAGRLLG